MTIRNDDVLSFSVTPAAANSCRFRRLATFSDSGPQTAGQLVGAPGILGQGGLGRDALGARAGIDRAGVPAVGQPGEARPDLAVARDQLLFVDPPELADGLEPVPLQTAAERLAHPPDGRDRAGREKVERLGAADGGEAARLVQVGCGLGEKLVVAETDRSGDAGLLLDPFDQPDQGLGGRRPVQGLGAAQVEKGLVHGKRLHQRRRVLHHAPDFPAEALVFLHVGTDDHGVGARLPGLEHGHRRMDAPGAGDVAAGRDDAAPAAADDHRLVGQFRIVPLLHGRVKRVAVDVRDGQIGHLRVAEQPGRAALGAAVRRRRRLEQVGAIAAQAGRRLSHRGSPPATAMPRPAPRSNRRAARRSSGGRRWRRPGPGSRLQSWCRRGRFPVPFRRSFR